MITIRIKVDWKSEFQIEFKFGDRYITDSKLIVIFLTLEMAYY